MSLLACVNLIAFTAFGLDKRRAKKNKWRIREKTLLILCACFGALGGFCGMRVFRHKTRKAAFTVGIPVMLTVQCALAGYVIWRFCA